MKPDISQFKKQKVDLSQFKKPVSNGLFNVPEDKAYDSRQRLNAAQEDQVTIDKEASKGFFSRFGSALAKNLIPSEIGLGKTLAGIGYQGSKTNESVNQSIASGQDSQVQLLKAIREAEAAGRNADNLKRIYNEAQKRLEKTTTEEVGRTELPTNLQAAGQIGGTALDLLTMGTYGKAKTAAMGSGSLYKNPAAKGLSQFLVPGSAVKNVATGAGLPELGAIAGQKAGGLFSLKGAGNIAKGAGIGYASDVTLGLQGFRGEDRDNGGAFIPGLGTALGATIPAISEAGQTFKNVKGKGLPFTEQRTMNKRGEAVNEIRSRYTRTEKAFSAAERKGVDIQKTLAETNLLNGAVDDNGLVKVDKALENFNEFIAPFEGKVKTALAEEGRTVNLNNVVDDAVNFIDNSKLSDIEKTNLQKEIAKNLEAFKQFNGDSVPLTSVHDTKIFLGSRNNYLVPSKDIVDKEAARFFKELIEKNSTAMDVGGFNAEVSKYYAIRDAVDSLDKARVLNGRAGKYFASVVGGMAGATSGNPIIALAGAEGGARIRGVMMGNAFGGDISKGLEVSDAMVKAQNPLATGKEAIPSVVIPKVKSVLGDLNLGGQSKSSGKMSGSLKITQAPNPKTKANIIPKKSTPKVGSVKEVTPAKGLGEVTPKKDTGEFTNPISKKVHDGNKIPYDWASYTTTQKNQYLKSLEDFKLSTFERAKDLTPENRAIEEKAFRKVIAKEDELIAEYNKMEGTKGGKIINTDLFRRLFKDEGYAGYNAQAVQEPSSYLAKKAYTQALANNPGETVVMTAGGSGTGKSSALEGIASISDELENSAFVLDSNLSSYKSAISKITEAEKAGKDILIEYVYRDPYDSFEKGVVKRMLTNKEENGRLVPSYVVAGNHIDSLNVVKQLQDEGFSVTFVDNSMGPGKQVVSSYEEISKKANYPSKEKLTEEFNSIAKRLYDEGTITKEQYQGYLDK